MSDKHMLRVSCKCAIFTPDRLKVLVVEYGPDDYGLPGGHIESGENPEQAMQRELKEELGITINTATRSDFWMHQNGKLILGFCAVIDEAVQLTIQESEISAAIWVPVEKIARNEISVPSYDAFILKSI